MLFKDVTSAYIETAFKATQVPHIIHRAYRIANSERRVTCVILPNDVQMARMEEPPREHGMTHSGVGIKLAPIVPDASALMHVAEVLNAGQRVAVLVRAGALNTTDEVIAVADRLGAGVATALLGRGVLPDDLPLHRLHRAFGHQGELGSHAGLRHAPHGELGLPLHRIPALRGPGAGRTGG